MLAADTPTWIASLSAPAGVLVAVLGALYARKQLLDGRQTQKRQRVYDLQRQFDDDIFVLMGGLYSFTAKSPEDARNAWTNGQVNREQISRVLNFFEVIGGEYNNKLLDEKTAYQTLIYALVQSWPRVRWFVQWQRDRFGEDRIYDQWEKAYEKAVSIYSPTVG